MLNKFYIVEDVSGCMNLNVREGISNNDKQGGKKTMNKSGKKNMTSTLLTIGVIVIALILAVQFLKPTQQTALGTGSQVSSQGYIATGSTTFSYSAVDALSSGTTVGYASRTSVNDGAYTATVTTGSPGNKLNVLFVNNSNYHNAYVTGITVPAAPTMPLTVQFYKNSSATISMFNMNNVLLTNGGGANNQSVASAGQSFNLPIRFDGVDKTSTQDMRCILEATAGANVSDVVLTGLGAVKVGNSKPNWYSLIGTGSSVFVYDIAAVNGAVSPSGTVSLVSASGKTFAGNYLVITCYTKENFLDSSTGKVSYGTEDSLGNLQSMAAYTYKVGFN